MSLNKVKIFSRMFMYHNNYIVKEARIFKYFLLKKHVKIFFYYSTSSNNLTDKKHIMYQMFVFKRNL